MSGFNKTGPGKKAAVKSVDADAYMPEPGDWEETNILWQFDDGWLICDNITEYDRRLTAKLTLTCVAGLIPKCIPFDERGWEIQQREALITSMSSPTFFKRVELGDKFDEWQEKHIELKILEARGKRYDTGQPCFKIAHVRDPEQRPRACVLMVLADALDPAFRGRYGVINYASSNDYGQTHPIIIDGLEWRVLEARIGTGQHPPKVVEPYIIEWYKGATGQWDEDAYQKAVSKRQSWTAYNNHETDKQLQRFRRPELVTA